MGHPTWENLQVPRPSRDLRPKASRFFGRVAIGGGGLKFGQAVDTYN